jgi:uncharacterized protein DUF7007
MGERRDEMGTRTPWGTADHVKRYAEGVTFYGTPSHGGFKLAPKQNARVPEALRKASFCGNGERGWYEEDCDWNIVAFVFPELFTPAEAVGAREYVKNHYPAAFAAIKEAS